MSCCAAVVTDRLHSQTNGIAVYIRTSSGRSSSVIAFSLALNDKVIVKTVEALFLPQPG